VITSISWRKERKKEGKKGGREEKRKEGREGSSYSLDARQRGWEERLSTAYPQLKHPLEVKYMP
jgi:hypothetical protein